jgi:hypothetical protein
MGDRRFAPPELAFYYPPRFYKYYAATRLLRRERCWNYSTHVGESERYPTVCERCVEALEEIEASGLLS